MKCCVYNTAHCCQSLGEKNGWNKLPKMLQLLLLGNLMHDLHRNRFNMICNLISLFNCFLNYMPSPYLVCKIKSNTRYLCVLLTLTEWLDSIRVEGMYCNQHNIISASLAIRIAERSSIVMEHSSSPSVRTCALWQNG